MMLRQSQPHFGRHIPFRHGPRLRLKPKAPQTGYVDGAWWPRGHNLATELPDLLAVLSMRLGVVDRVSYHLDEWAETPRRLFAGGHLVHVDGYGRRPAKTLTVHGVNRSEIVLLGPRRSPCCSPCLHVS